MPNWTDEQRAVIDSSGGQIVSAAAGSGKTAVLTERIARLVCEGADISDFLVVTFTRAAAAEMKKRIASRLAELAPQMGSSDEAARINAAASGIGRASISTIDAFCAHVLRRHFAEAGLDPAFRAAEEAESAAARQEALDELLEESYSNSSFGALVDMFDGEENFTAAVLSLYSFLSAQPEPVAWLRCAAANYALSAEELAASPLVSEFIAASKRTISARMGALLYQRDSISEAYPATAAILDDDLAKVRSLMLFDSWEGYSSALCGVEFLRFAMRGAGDLEKKPVMDARKALKDAVAAQRHEFEKPLSFHAKRLNGLAPFLAELNDFMERFMVRYAEKKRETGVIDYADMEHMTLTLLSRPAIAAEYRARFKYLFVDEYQDCNPTQECIFTAIRRPESVFMVGDVKQSIYRFRMAEPEIFSSALKTAGSSARFLNANFRSSRAVVDTVNAVFSAVMSEASGGVDYDASARLVMGRKDAHGKAELHILPCGAALDREDTELFDEAEAQQLEAAEAEALLAAERIREIVTTSFTSARGETRQYRYSDIVILHSSPKNIAETWVRTLSRDGIPAYAETTGGYFEAIEVQIFLNLLRIIDNRRQDIPLLSVLRSPIAGFTVEELILMRADFPSADCFGSLALAAESDTPLGAKVAAFIARLDKWRRDAELYDVCELIGMLCDDTGFETFVSALPGGESRRGNLSALTSSAAVYQRGGHGLSGFIRFMDKIKNTGRMGAAQIASANVVRVISIHKSKGLEFPVVFLAGLGKQFNTADKSARIVMDSRLGLGIRPVRFNTRLNTLCFSSVSRRAWQASVSEQMRLLYVGMTRASEQLIMLCALKNVPAALASAVPPPSPASASEAMHFSDWVLPSLMNTPSGNPMRAVVGLPPLSGEAVTDVYLHGSLSASSLERYLPRERYLEFAAAAREESDHALTEALSWRYPHPEDVSIPSKLSVSQLLGNRPELAKYPEFLRESVPPTPAERGSAAHVLMQLISLAPHTEETVRQEISLLVQRGLLSTRQAGMLSLDMPVAFFASGLGKRLLASPRVERELPFNHYVKASALLSAQTDEPVLLQGVIDCCFIENNAWILIDHKTDFVPHGQSAAIAARHRPQLLLYKNALEGLTNIPVAEMYVNFLSVGISERL